MQFSYGIADLQIFHKEEGLKKLEEVGGVQSLARSLNVQLDRGPTSDQATYLQAAFGENRVPERPPKSYLAYLWEACGDFTIQLLCVCAVLSIVIAVAFQSDEELSWLEGVAILGTVAAVCNLQAAQDWTKERSFRKLNAESSVTFITAIRDGERCSVSKYNLVVGDVVTIGAGDILEADGLVIRSADLELDESALTGEPEDVRKDAKMSPQLFSGTSVKNGSGCYLVTAVGINSMSGRITGLIRGLQIPENKGGTDASEAKEESCVKEENSKKGTEKAEEEEEDTSVLRRKLNIMVGRIAIFAFSSAGIASLSILARFVVINYVRHGNDWSWSNDPAKILNAVVTGIAIVVVAVPEGLPLAVTLALTLSMMKMQKDNNLVKHIDATETMGSATTICSDKTGTLTQNRMTVMRTSIGGQEFTGEDGIDRTCGTLMRDHLADSKDSIQVQQLLCQAICLGCDENANIEWDEVANRWQQQGNKTDCALLAFSYDLGYKKQPDGETSGSGQTPGSSNHGLKLYPFSSSRKRSGIFVPLTADPRGPCRLYMKGASEIMLRLCSHRVVLDGSIVELSERMQTQLTTSVEKYASMAMRTLVLAYRDFPAPPDWDAELPQEKAALVTGLTAKMYEVEVGLTFIGLMGIHDPIHEQVPHAISQCTMAGVDVRMVTGDHKATAVAIAKECGILRRGIDFVDEPAEPLVHEFTAMTGNDFRDRVLVNGRIDQAAFDEIWPHLRVLARSSPEDKHTLVSGICESELFATERGKELCIFPDKQVVAVTGDGTNDAPALRRAHVGFAMKITGTRIAQDAADILLLDDNFASVVRACMWGRNVYDSIAKFLQFQLTVNVSAVSISLLGSVIFGEAPLSVVQMLWVNLIMDSLGALALASEPPTDALLQRTPYGKNRGLISFEMACSIIGQSAYQLVVLVLLFVAGAGPGRPLDEDESFDWPEGGIMGIESGVGRGHHAAPTAHYTLLFNCFVFMQLFNWINCRKLHFEWNAFDGLQNNLPFCAILATCALVQLALVQAAAIGGGSGVNKIFKTRALSAGQWYLCLFCGACCIPLQWLIIGVASSLRPKKVQKAPVNPPKIAVAPASSNGAGNGHKIIDVTPAPETTAMYSSLPGVWTYGEESSSFQVAPDHDTLPDTAEDEVIAILSKKYRRFAKYARQLGTEYASWLGSNGNAVLLCTVFSHWRTSVEWKSHIENLRTLEVRLQRHRWSNQFAIARRREMVAATLSFWGSYAELSHISDTSRLREVFFAWHVGWLRCKTEWEIRMDSSWPVNEIALYIPCQALWQDRPLFLAVCFRLLTRLLRQRSRHRKHDSLGGELPPIYNQLFSHGTDKQIKEPYLEEVGFTAGEYSNGQGGLVHSLMDSACSCWVAPSAPDESKLATQERVISCTKFAL